MTEYDEFISKKAKRVQSFAATSLGDSSIENMHSTTLPPDAPRCNGIGCQVKTNCRRYLQRESGKKIVNTWNHHKEPECFFQIKENDD